MKKDLLSVADLTAQEIWQLLHSALDIKQGKGRPGLQGKVLALLFEKPSLRTRVSFEVAMYQLGGQSLYLSPQEVGLGKREAVADVARVLSRYVNGLAVRTFSQSLLVELARFASIPVINALSDEEHPCQALADLLTVLEKKGRLEGLVLTFVGDGNNVANSLLLACALVGMEFRIASPPGYQLQEAIVRRARRLSPRARLLIEQEPRQMVAGADIIYTDVWTSMGQEAEAEERRRVFAPYQVNETLLALAKKDALLMHPLPAHHGEEVAPGLLDQPASVVFDQAENRLHLQKALLAELLGGKAGDERR